MLASGCLLDRDTGIVLPVLAPLILLLVGRTLSLAEQPYLVLTLHVLMLTPRN